MKRLMVAVADSVFPNLDPAREVLLKAGAGLRLASAPTAEDILQVAQDADGLLVTYAKISSDLIRQLKRCRVIARFGIGVDNVDVEAATACGIVVTRVPDYCIDEVSDHTLALLLALARKIPFANSGVHQGKWEMSAVIPIHRLRGRILGLVGFGRISQLVALKAKSFGLKILTCDPYISGAVTRSAGVEAVSFNDLVRVSDYISIHTPLLPETKHLFNADVFRNFKPTAFLINTARGPIVDETALAQALDEGQLAGAGLDVLSQEPPIASPLLGRDNVILTPHTSFYSVESLVELQTKAAEEIVRVLGGQMPQNAVNPEAFNPAVARNAT
jgi:D-3-phosphoglycerate dehydrogenase / 2-oxoglutarate reductase